MINQVKFLTFVRMLITDLVCTALETVLCQNKCSRVIHHTVTLSNCDSLTVSPPCHCMTGCGTLGIGKGETEKVKII